MPNDESQGYNFTQPISTATKQQTATTRSNWLSNHLSNQPTNKVDNQISIEASTNGRVHSRRWALGVGIPAGGDLQVRKTGFVLPPSLPPPPHFSWTHFLRSTSQLSCAPYWKRERNCSVTTGDRPGRHEKADSASAYCPCWSLPSPL